HPCCHPHCLLHAFPTRRSSDLNLVLVQDLQDLQPLGSIHFFILLATSAQSQRYYIRECQTILQNKLYLHVASKSFQPKTRHAARDRKSTRLNSSHVKISYAVFC